MTLEVGVNTIEIIVEAEDGTIKTYEITVTVGLKGDVNLDGVIDITDWQQLAQFLLNRETPSEQAHWNADLNDNGEITLGDWVQLANMILDIR